MRQSRVTVYVDFKIFQTIEGYLIKFFKPLQILHIITELPPVFLKTHISEESTGEEEPVDYSLFFNKDSVFGKVSAQLLHGSIQLLEFEPSGTHRELVKFSFADLAVGAEYRMKTDTIIVSASLQVLIYESAVWSYCASFFKILSVLIFLS